YTLYQNYRSLLSGGTDMGGADIDDRLGAAFGEFVEVRDEKVQDRSLQRYRLEFHKKFAIPFACLAFVFLAFPVGLIPRRSGRSVGFGLGLLVAVVYWSLLIAGDTLGGREMQISPVLAMWVPNLLVLLVGLVVYAVRKVR
ncbi:MAG: LptF/LptG family permease, partial [Spirochaetota bacterium]